ncbi:hypothetical protein BGZ91_002272 [Linnemannia elongata]|nr:hypothetical protein BGZ91_002272 [Linnemannia elongata]
MIVLDRRQRKRFASFLIYLLSWVPWAADHQFHKAASQSSASRIWNFWSSSSLHSTAPSVNPQTRSYPSPLGSSVQVLLPRSQGVRRASSDWMDVKEHDFHQLSNGSKTTVWRCLIVESADLKELSECTICLEQLRIFDTLSCGHRSYTNCISTWSESCPHCRFNRYLATDRTADTAQLPKPRRFEDLKVWNIRKAPR